MAHYTYVCDTHLDMRVCALAKDKFTFMCIYWLLKVCVCYLYVLFMCNMNECVCYMYTCILMNVYMSVYLCISHCKKFNMHACKRSVCVCMFAYFYIYT